MQPRALVEMVSAVEEVVEIPFAGQPVDVVPDADGNQPHPTDTVCPFITGPENRLVQVAVDAFLAKDSPEYSPLVFFGPSGTGKSHLALGLVAAWRAKYPKRRVVHTCAIDFARELAEAIETKTTADFGRRYRRAALLVVEDLGYLKDKKAAQRELLAVFDNVWNAKGRLVLTSSVPPAKLSQLIPALQSRLMAGLTVPLLAPGHAARRVLIDRLARARGLELDTAAIDCLAKGLSATTPTLVRALIELEVAAREDGKPIDVGRIDKYLKHREGSQNVRLPTIAKTTAKHFAIRLGDLRSASRRRGTVLARSIAMYLARTHTQDSLREIGQYFGGRDHTTVSHACRKIEHDLRNDLQLQSAVDELRDLLNIEPIEPRTRKTR